MKTIKIIFLSALLMVSSNLVFAGGPDAVGYPDNLYKHLQKKIDYPRYARENDLQGVVLISFEVDKYGFIHIREMNASNPMLKQHVEKQIQSIRLCPFDINAGMVHNMKFNFHLKDNA